MTKPSTPGMPNGPEIAASSGHSRRGTAWFQHKGADQVLT
jgi:hypothetical protein